MFHKILVTVDGSHHDASLCRLHAFPHVSDLLGTPYHQSLLAALQRRLRRSSSKVPAQTSLRAAAEGQYDLIRYGSDG